MSEPSILSTQALAVLLGVTPRALNRIYHQDATFAGCAVRRTRRSTWWSVQRLRDRGYLTKISETQAAPNVQAVAS